MHMTSSNGYKIPAGPSLFCWMCASPGNTSIANTQLMPMQSIPGKIDTLDKDAHIVVICHHGVRSMQVARFLEHSGFEQVYNLQGGVDSWAQLVDTSMPTY
jgi:rhodanese-related sulfurtransferase